MLGGAALSNNGQEKSQDFFRYCTLQRGTGQKHPLALMPVFHFGGGRHWICLPYCYNKTKTTAWVCRPSPSSALQSRQNCLILVGLKNAGDDSDTPGACIQDSIVGKFSRLIPPIQKMGTETRSCTTRLCTSTSCTSTSLTSLICARPVGGYPGLVDAWKRGPKLM